MTDRELLELAAKAVGIKHSGPKGGPGLWVGHRQGILSGTFGSTRWTPLTDDGDALRLAVKLGLSISVFAESIDPRTEVCVRADGSLFVDEAPRHNGDDPYAATRRAIVRAAAEIGKEKQND